MRKDFCAFILTHGRPNKQSTYRSIRRHGYTGRVYFVVDDKDPTLAEYQELYGDDVLVFSKDKVGESFDQFDNSNDQRAIVWARNACWELAEQVGARYFIQLDDDYTAFVYRRTGHKQEGVHGYHSWSIKNLDRVLTAMVNFVDTSQANTLCMSQGGDHFQGSIGNINHRLTRKSMNSFVCDTQRPFTFVGRVNEDVNTYVSLGHLGQLFFTYMPLQLTHTPTQQSSGGMTEMYLDAGTYVKSFYTVMAAPSCTTIREMGTAQKRLHHKINWHQAVPKIIRETVKHK